MAKAAGTDRVTVDVKHDLAHRLARVIVIGGLNRSEFLRRAIEKAVLDAEKQQSQRG